MLAGLLVACVLCADNPATKPPVLEVKRSYTVRQESEKLGTHYLLQFEDAPVLAAEDIEQLSVYTDDRFLVMDVQPTHYLQIHLTSAGLEKLQAALKQPNENDVLDSLSGQLALLVDSNFYGHITPPLEGSWEDGTVLVRPHPRYDDWRKLVPAFNNSRMLRQNID